MCLQSHGRKKGRMVESKCPKREDERSNRRTGRRPMGDVGVASKKHCNPE